jgi:drug/metabolite transporter (DMT)-like permease
VVILTWETRVRPWEIIGGGERTRWRRITQLTLMKGTYLVVGSDLHLEIEVDNGLVDYLSEMLIVIWLGLLSEHVGVAHL